MNQNHDNDDLTTSYEAPMEMAPEGRHLMLCVDVFETWSEEETWDEGKTYKTARKIIYAFQVFPEDGSMDSEGNTYRVDHKVTLSLYPTSKMRPFLESWLGMPHTQGNWSFNPKTMVGKAAWGTLEQTTRYTKIIAIEPYVDDDGKPLPAPEAAPYLRRTYPKPETWKNKSNGNSKEPAQASAPAPVSASKTNTNPYDPIPF